MYPSPKFKQNKGSKSSLTIFGEGGTQNLELKFIICKDRYWRCDGPPWMGCTVGLHLALQFSRQLKYNSLKIFLESTRSLIFSQPFSESVDL